MKKQSTQTLFSNQAFFDRICSVLKDSAILEDIMEVDRSVKEFKADVFDVVCSENIEGETSQFGKDMRIGANARSGFPQRHIADIMISILNAPVISDGLTEVLGTQPSG